MKTTVPLAPGVRSSYIAAMQFVLQPHPAFASTAVSSVAVDLSRTAVGSLLLRYRVAGNCTRLNPRPSAESVGQRVDELWRHSCFEAFVKPAGGDAYWEFNLSPTGDWQVYRFDGYRTGRSLPDVTAPEVEIAVLSDALELRALWQLGDILPGSTLWQLGLCAVIDDGAINYWALHHAPGQPDFHHASAFALELPETP